MDKLKDFVGDHRAEFDNLEPRQLLWESIEARLSENTPPLRIVKKPWRKMGIAASVAVLIALGITWSKYRRPLEKNRAVIQLSPVQGSELIRFAGSVDQKREEIESLSAGNPELKKEFQQDILMLGEQYEELRNSLPNNPNQDEILNEMKKNLQWQMELLERQKEIINQEKRQKEGMVFELYEDQELPVSFV